MTENGPKPFRCEDCPEHSGTKKDIEHQRERLDDLISRAEKLDRQWEEHMDFAHRSEGDLQRRIGEKIPIRHGIFTLGIVVSIFTTIVGFNLAYNGRVEDKLDNMVIDLTRLETSIAERARYEDSMKQLVQTVQDFKQQEARQDEEIIDRTRRTIDRYGKPGD